MGPCLICGAKDFEPHHDECADATPTPQAQAGDIPAGVYYSTNTGNFHDTVTHKGMGNDFFDRWHPDTDRFPRDPSPARDAGAVACHRWSRNGEPLHWLDGVPSERQMAAQRACKPLADWTVEYAYTHPAAQVEDARDAAAVGWNACRRQVYSLCEHIGDEPDDRCPDRFVEGRRSAAKSIAKAMGAFEAADCDILRAALSSPDGLRKGEGV